MSFLDRFEKSPSGDELLGHLRKFLSGCSEPECLQNLDLSPQNRVLKDLVETGFYLMRQLPVAREAVFYQISRIYDNLVNDYISNLDLDELTLIDTDSELLEIIHSAFNHFLDIRSDVWAPILSTWALQLLGQMSTQYTGRPIFSRCQSVNETIHIWMSSKAIKSLLDITSRCLHSSQNKDAFISALLDTSASHSPNFDWVVAHVGNSFPQTVVSEVLSLGLQNFSSNPPQVSKISSVVGILGHLVTTHSAEIQFSFDRILTDGINASNSIMENFAVPYLLQLCSSSVALLDALMDSVIPKVNDETLDRLKILVPQWIALHFGGREIAFLALVTHLILKSTRGPKILNILLVGCKTWPQPVKASGQFLLDQFKAEISSLIYRSDASRQDLGKSFPCVPALKDNADSILPFLIDPEPYIASTSQQFIKILSLYDSKDVGVQAVCFLFRQASQDSHLWLLVDFVCTLSLKYPAILEDCIILLSVANTLKPSNQKQSQYQASISNSNSNSMVTSQPEPDPVPQAYRHWHTILRLMKSEQLSMLPERFKLTQTLKDKIVILSSFLDVRKKSFSLKEASLVVEILSGIPDITTKVRFGTILTIERYLVELLFNVLGLRDKSERLEKIGTVSNISNLLHQLSSNHAVQNDALRSLVQSCLNPECRPIFLDKVVLHKSVRDSEDGITGAEFGMDTGAVAGPSSMSMSAYDDEEFQPERLSMYASLLNENKRRIANVSLARIHSTSFQSDQAMKNRNRNISTMWSISPKIEIVDNEDAQLNITLFLSVLTNVCTAFPVNNNAVNGSSTNGRFNRPKINNGNGGNGKSQLIQNQILGQALGQMQASGSSGPGLGIGSGVSETLLLAEAAAIEDGGLLISVEAMRKVALLLVEIVSPDVMFNGLPWPDEEFSKVQVERDLQIRKSFEEHPYLWNLLELVANYCPSLCYCSVLLRALMATLMAHWNSCQEAKSREFPSQLEWTIRLVNVMSTGQLLPPPLCHIGQVVHELKASEILGLLKDIWSYMKMNVPVPTVFLKDPQTKKFIRNPEFFKLDPNYSEKLRLSILNNVEKLGHLFPALFPLLPTPNPNNGANNGDGSNGKKKPGDLGNNGNGSKFRPPQIQSPSPTKEIPAIPTIPLIQKP